MVDTDTQPPPETQSNTATATAIPTPIPTPAGEAITTSNTAGSSKSVDTHCSLSPSLHQLVARLNKPDYGNDSSSEEEGHTDDQQTVSTYGDEEDRSVCNDTNANTNTGAAEPAAMGSLAHRRNTSLTPSEMVPLTTVRTDGMTNCSDLELGYEDPADPDGAVFTGDHDHPNPNTTTSPQEKLPEEEDARTPSPDGEGTDLEEDDEDEHCHDDEELPVWERIPFGLALAMALFTISSLFSLRMVILHLSQNHGKIYTTLCTLLIAVGFLLPAYIVGNTIWFNCLELEHLLEQQDRTKELLKSAYPKHILKTLLPDHDGEQDCTTEHHDDDALHMAPTAPPAQATATMDEQSLKQLVEQHLRGQPQEPLDRSHHSQESSDHQHHRLSNHYQQPPPPPTSQTIKSKINNGNHTPGSNDLHPHQRHSHHASSSSSRSVEHNNNHNHNLHCTTLCTPEKHSRICIHHPKTIANSIIDLFANTTVFYAEIVGFTAWSSTRAPRQVFDLLQSVFCQFDQQAKQGRVLRIESMADSYIAVTGLPEPDPQHAVRMAQFASDCLTVFLETCHRMERQLGPDTGELQLRIGLHSGPVTAGVLQGDKGRFQLFGNTVNNAVLVEKQGQGNRIHMTRDTAELLEGAGKHHWIAAREKSAAGKTYWLTAAEEAERRPSCSHGAAVPVVEEYWDDENHIEEVDMESIGTGTGSQDFDDNMSQFSNDTGITTVISTASTDSRKAWTMQDILTAKEQRLIEWTVDQLALMLQKIVARRNAILRYEERMGTRPAVDDGQPPPFLHYTPSDQNQTVLDEVKEMIVIPHYKSAVLLDDALEDYETVELPDRVLEELTNYVSTVTTFYYSPDRNPFHNFMHASHVLMSVVKMLERIISPSQMALEQDKKKNKKSRRRKKKKNLARSCSWSQLHDHTFGITTDPLTQFACVFAALIHDLDHPGVPNAQLVKEQSRLARIYKNRSISEQNSLDMAWDLLMDPSYQTLVRTICSCQDELKRFRQLLVQTVMATDIADAELRAARNARWDMAFAKKQEEKKEGDHEHEGMDDSNASLTPEQEHEGMDDSNASLGAKRETEEETEDDKNRKATIVLEHLLQASDIAHTMQHWEVFRKWNEKLYREMYLAYLHGRAEKDPVEFWYKGEIGFFKFYIIPLAKKLSDCGVFGVSSDEYLNYAEQNLEIWELRGEEVVKEVSERAYRDFGRKEDQEAA